LKWDAKELARRLEPEGGLLALAHSRSVKALSEQTMRHSALGELPSQALESLFQIGRVEIHRKGSVLIREGEVDRDVWILLDGAVRITNQAGTLNAQAGVGAVLGELALLGRRPRSATVRTERPTRTLRLSEEKLEALMQEYPGIGMILRRLRLR
jgi:cAMP-dependent protein kinase regulator